jgi:hypothetical protein
MEMMTEASAMLVRRLITLSFMLDEVNGTRSGSTCRARNLVRTLPECGGIYHQKAGMARLR